MKIGKTALNLLNYFIRKDIKKRREHYPPHSFKEWINVPYVDDGNLYHTYDVYLANEDNRKRVCIIDIHGGAYILGEHQDNYPFAYYFLNKGYDVVSTDYIPNNGKRSSLELVKDVVNNILHLLAHLKDYDLEDDKIVLAGDSAGGHFALLIAELFKNKNAAKELGFDLPDLDIKAVVLCCPVYNFEDLGKGVMSKSGLKRMLGPTYKDPELLRKLSPRTYVKFFDLPIFVSTCTNDFIRTESLLLNDELKERNNFQFYDLKCDDKNVDHVHNVVKLNLKESIMVNDEIVTFIDKYTK